MSNSVSQLTDLPVGLPHGEVAGVLATVHASQAHASTKRTFAYLVLTASRSQEVTGARWDEIDRDAAVWTIPAERMKSGRDDRRPLSPHALAVVPKLPAFGDGGGLVFPGARGTPLSSSALSRLLHGLGTGAALHSFRVSFCHWCADTSVSHEVAEFCLGHSLPGGLGGFGPSDLLVSRRKVMEDWGAYVLPHGLPG